MTILVQFDQFEPSKVTQQKWLNWNLLPAELLTDLNEQNLVKVIWAQT